MLREFETKIHQYLPTIKAVFLILFLLIGFTREAVADPVSDAEAVPATAAEMQFINRVIDQVKAAVPPLDGWERDLSSYLGDDQGGFRQGDEILIYEYDRNAPLKLTFNIKFHRNTAAEKKEAVEEKSTQELQQEMMAALEIGDMEKVQQLQLKQAAMLQKQMETGVFGQAAKGEPGSQAPREKAAEFFVTVVVNGGGERIGKQYDMSVPGVTHAFRVDKNKKDHLSYKYYLGGWEVSELDKKNWKIIFPKSAQTAANHLHSLVLYANVYGDRESVESYVKNSLNLKGLNSVLN
ncbi:hypothetical protein MUP29_02530 [bacterium]|nr:hypothetical protein [bacterium]